MTWENYVKFREVAVKELNYPYVFQDYTTDQFFDISPMARIRNSQTTGCTKWEFENVNDKFYNRGIFIDIWVLFPIPTIEYREEMKNRINSLWRAIRGWYAENLEKNGKQSPYHQYLPDWQKASIGNTIAEIKSKYIDCCNWGGL